MTLRALSKKMVERAGGFALRHRLRNRECLTVTMFHRILPAKEQLRLGADPEYAITPGLLADVLAFLGHHYSFVSLDDVLASRAGRRPLPPYPLLVTFDDGWRDNLEYALPVLKAAGVPWVLFAAIDAMSASKVWWQEALQWALRTGQASYEDLWYKGGGGDFEFDAAKPSDLALLLRYGALSEEARTAVLAPYAAGLQAAYGGNIMLDAAGLRTLRVEGVAIGGHGASHLPLTAVADAQDEATTAKNWLTANVDEAAADSMSFPHGRHDASTINAARSAGYKLLFTSDKVLNPCPAGWITTDLLGRIYVATPNVSSDGSSFAPERLAPWLMLRERKQLAG